MKTVIRVLIPFVLFLMILSCISPPNLEGTWHDCSNKGGYDLTISKVSTGYSGTANGVNVYFDSQGDTLLTGVNEDVTIKYVSSTKHLLVSEGSDTKEYCKK